MTPAAHLSESPRDIARTASLASQTLKAVGGTDRDDALTAIHKALKDNQDVIFEANKQDMAEAQQQVEAGKMKSSMAKRLLLDEPKFAAMLEGILDVRNLQDPGRAHQLQKETSFHSSLTLPRSRQRHSCYQAR